MTGWDIAYVAYIIVAVTFITYGLYTWWTKR